MYKIRNSPELLDDVDVAEVDAGGGRRVDDPHHGVHAHGGEQAGVLRHHLGAQRGGGAVEQSLAVAQLHRLADGDQDLHALIHRLLERLRDGGRVDACGERERTQSPGCNSVHKKREQRVKDCSAYLSVAAWRRRPAERRRSPPQTWCRLQPRCPEPWTARPAKTNTHTHTPHYKCLLSFPSSPAGTGTAASHHFGGGMKDLHLIQDGGSVVSDGDVTFPILDLQHKSTVIIITTLHNRIASGNTSECRGGKKINK